MSIPPSDPRQQYPNFNSQADLASRNRRGPSNRFEMPPQLIGVSVAIASVVIIGIAISAAWTTLFGDSNSVPGIATEQQMDTMKDNAKKEADDDIKAQNIYDAIAKYKKDTTFYPNSLFDLIPDYLPSDWALHASTDPAVSTLHVSFNYRKPIGDETPLTPLFTYDCSTPMTMEMGSVGMDTKTTYLANGKTIVDTIQTMPAQGGKTMAMDVRIDNSTNPPTMSMDGSPPQPIPADNAQPAPLYTLKPLMPGLPSPNVVNPIGKVSY